MTAQLQTLLPESIKADAIIRKKKNKKITCDTLVES